MILIKNLTWKYCDVYTFYRTTGFDTIAKLLLENGANVDAVEIYKNTPLHYAVSGTTYGHYNVADLLIQHGADVDAINSQNGTPMDHVRLAKSKF